MVSSPDQTAGAFTGSFEARAATRSYVLYAGPWAVLGLLSAQVALDRSGVLGWLLAGLCLAAAALLTVGLRRFRVTIKDGALVYQDMRRRTQRCQLADILWCESQWLSEQCFGKNWKLLRLVVELRDGGDIRIHMRPFSLTDLARMKELLRVNNEPITAHIAAARRLRPATPR